MVLGGQVNSQGPFFPAFSGLSPSCFLGWRPGQGWHSGTECQFHLSVLPGFGTLEVKVAMGSFHGLALEPCWPCVAWVKDNLSNACLAAYIPTLNSPGTSFQEKGNDVKSWSELQHPALRSVSGGTLYVSLGPSMGNQVLGSYLWGHGASVSPGSHQFCGFSVGDLPLWAVWVVAGCGSGLSTRPQAPFLPLSGCGSPSGQEPGMPSGI